MFAQMQMSHGNNSSSMPVNAAPPTQPMLHVLELPPFVDELPLPERLHAAPGKKLRVSMREIHAKVHRDLPPTRMWSYGDTAIAPLIEARANQPLHIEWRNDLPTKHFLPIDHSLHGAGRDRPEVRAIVHVHGARVPTKDDGHPDDWYTPGNSLACTYPLHQEAATLWYHDHAMGINRLNTYAGLFGFFLVRDHVEDALHLPSGKYELPLILYDRDFTADGQFFYPSAPDPEHPWVSEFAGDAILINGKIRPYHQVEPRLYRLRLVNAANSRFFALSFTDRQPFHQIGSDQGLLPAALKQTGLNLAPAERADILVDFSQSAGKNVHLMNGALEILEFRVAAQPAVTQPIPTALRPIPRLAPSTAIKTRTILLGEHKDSAGNSMVMLLNRKRWHEPVTEQPRLNTTEIWEFINMTEDTHPMHLHLVRFQVLDRRVFDVFAYDVKNVMRYMTQPLPPEPGEMGWKDVVQCPPGMITRIIVHFEGYAGSYLYHCHILEHEANDMMRPFEVIA
ncbi:bilirubin oxidase [Granulicella sp. WH15]|nr:bilirubin oxidase [Granulicella sp. WH15]